MIRRLMAVLLALLTLGGAAAAEFPGLTGDVQAWLDAPPDMTAGAEWYVLALAHTGEYDFIACHGALLAALESASPAAHTTRLKYALVLRATGSADPVIARTLAESAGQQGVMSHVWALHLLHYGVITPEVSPEGTVQALLALQLADGGWALRGAVSDPDVTAMVLQALAPHQGAEAVRAAIDRALARLSALQRPEGDYASFGTPNPETTAQVIIALTELGIDPASDPRFVKDGVTLPEGLARYCLPDGRFAHTSDGPANQNATTQAFLAGIALELLHAGKPGLYQPCVPDAVPQTAASTAPAALSWRTIAVVAVLLAAALGCGVLLIQRRPRRNCLVIAAAAALAVAVILTVDLQSADSYYTGRLPDKPDAIGTVTLSIVCNAALGHPDAAGLPENGVILSPMEIPLAPGDTVFTLLTQAAQANGFHLETSGSTGMRYVQGIANLYEFSLGDLSGWLYYINGESLSLSCDQAMPAPGDVIEWRYTLEMGNDLNP